MSVTEKQSMIMNELASIINLKTASFNNDVISISTKDYLTSEILDRLRTLGEFITIKRSGDGLRILLKYDFN